MTSDARQPFTIDQLRSPTPGAIAIGPFGSRMKSDTYTATGVPVIRGTNLGTTKSFQGDFVFISEADADSFGNCNVYEGDLVFPHRGNIGEVGIVTGKGSRYIISSSLMKLTVDRSLTDPAFLFYWFKSSQGRHALLANASQVGTPGIATPLASLRSIKLTIPSPEKQREVAHILGTLDDKIELNRRMNATLEAMARALFQSWFVDFDPVRAKAAGQTPAGMNPATAALFPSEFEDSALGEIPKGWKVGTLGEVLKATSNGVSVEEMDDNAAYIGLEHMPRRSIALDQWGTAAELQSNKSSFKRGDILFGKLRPYFHKVGIAPVDGVCSTDILVLNPSSPAWSGFAFCHCISDKLIAHATALSNGAKMPRTKWPDLRDYKVVLPTEPLAGHFNKQLGPLFGRIIANIHESRTLAALRDALLPRLLSGELNTQSSNPGLST
jgi:type I restriction enzyme S subunit